MAQVERSSSHTKTSKFWSLLTLFLRQPPNYTQLCGRIFKKNPPTPFCPHPAPKSLYKGEPLLFHRKSVKCRGMLVQKKMITGFQCDKKQFIGKFIPDGRLTEFKKDDICTSSFGEGDFFIYTKYQSVSVSVYGDTGWYLVIQGQSRTIMFGTWWYWV